MGHLYAQSKDVGVQYGPFVRSANGCHESDEPTRRTGGRSCIHSRPLARRFALTLVATHSMLYKGQLILTICPVLGKHRVRLRDRHMGNFSVPYNLHCVQWQ